MQILFCSGRDARVLKYSYLYCMKKLSAACVCLLIIIIMVVPSRVISQGLVINEIMTSNEKTIADEDGDFPDWIELFNAGITAVTLTGFGLSDNPDTPFKWVFPDMVLGAGSYLLVWASGKDRKNPGSPLHTNFSISAAGEDVLLTYPGGNLAHQIGAVAIPTDISYGLKPGEPSDWYFFSEPTPGAANTTHAFNGVIPALSFSHPGGFYTESFDLAITTTTDGVSIRYTLDGSLPDNQSAMLTNILPIGSRAGTPNNISLIPTNNNNVPGPPYYEGWQPPAGEVLKSHVVRAVAMKENYLSSPVATQNYLVDPAGATRYSLPVFFLNTGRGSLFDPDSGIYFPGNHNNMFQRGDNWERAMHLSFYEDDGTLAFSDDFGMRLHGGTTRSRPRKSIRVYARNEYGPSWLNYQLFPEKDINRFKRFLLRNSGNDWDQSVFRDGFMQYLARDLAVETQYYRPSILFINGEYWGIHNIRDRYDEQYILSHYGLEAHEMTVLEKSGTYLYGNPDGQSHYHDMRDFVQHNSPANEANFAHVNTLMDTESFADFQIAQIFIMNTDWPGNNTNFFRRYTNTYLPDELPGRDGRWRWMILDTDFGFGLDFFYVPGVGEGPAHNTLAMALDPSRPDNHWPNPAWSTFLLRSLLNNTEYKHYYINRFADLMNTTFRESHVVAVIDSIEQVLSPVMQEHIDRWRRPVSMAEWHQNVERMRNFGRQRAGFLRQHILNQFGLAGTANVTIIKDAHYMGSVRVNTVFPDFGRQWSGVYFRGVPVEIEAIARTGYVFSHWSGTYSSSDDILRITPEGDLQVVAHFIPDPDFTMDELSPQAYPLSEGPYTFDHWGSDQPEGSFPPHMLFLQSAMDDPKLADEMTARYHIPDNDYHAADIDLKGFPYKLTGRTRLNGLNADGISFINTGRGRDLGAAVLALDTRELSDITVTWTGGTLEPNARVYAIRLQYKTGLDGHFRDVLFPDGRVVEYVRSAVIGHQQRIGPVVLPADAENNAYVQIRWKYYYTGERLDADHGRRDMLRLDDILVTASALDKGLVLNVKMRVWRDHHQRFNPDHDYVDVAGTFNGWDGVNHRLSRVEGDPDLTYTIAVPDLAIGESYAFKFRVNGSWADGMHDFPGGGPNRQITMQDGKNEYTYWFNDEEPATSLEAVGVTDVRIFPNPVSDILTIISYDMIHEIRLINATGQTVYSKKPDSESTHIDTGNFIPGLYFLKLYTAKGWAVERVLIAR